jgi:hypothetical protein
VKSTRKRHPCPVAALLLLLLQTCCRREGDPLADSPQPDSSVLISHPAALTPVEGFSLSPAPAETVEVTWKGGGPAEIVSIRSFADGTVALGDTLFLLEEGLRQVEIQRLEMELQLAEAFATASPSDEAARLHADSLLVMLESLQRAAIVPATSPAGGILLSMGPEEGEVVVPGTLLALLSVGPESLFVVSPPAGVTISSWPAQAGSLKLVEPLSSTAVYYGVPATDGSDFGSLFSVVRNALFEDGLRTFMITQTGDTLETGMVGSSESGIIVRLPQGEAGMEVRTWGS